jgi:peptidyl-prolyl cis-trans isomerase SurA
MKYLLSLFIALGYTSLQAQVYDRTTNNNRQYTDSTAKHTIDSLYTLVVSGQSFGDLATKYSQDPGSYKRGGELPPTSMEEYVDEYRKEVLTLSVNEVSKPFKTDFGYHIVQLTAKNDHVYSTRHILIRTD